MNLSSGLILLRASLITLGLLNGLMWAYLAAPSPSLPTDAMPMQVWRDRMLIVRLRLEGTVAPEFTRWWLPLEGPSMLRVQIWERDLSVHTLVKRTNFTVPLRALRWGSVCACLEPLMALLVWSIWSGVLNHRRAALSLSRHLRPR